MGSSVCPEMDVRSPTLTCLGRGREEAAFSAAFSMDPVLLDCRERLCWD